VAILMMFGIMLTRDVEGASRPDLSRVARVPAALAAVGILAVLSYGIAGERGLGDRRPWAEIRARPPVGPDPILVNSPRGRAVNDMGRVLGHELMGRYALPFEVAGLLLTAALVGSIALASDDRSEGVKRQSPGSRTSTEPVASGVRS
jgi:NADH-quinone oxidoreductase subunit J